MTKRHFEAIAVMIRERLDHLNNPSHQGVCLDRIDELETLADNLAQLCYRENPRFDRSRFLKACGLEG